MTRNRVNPDINHNKIGLNAAQNEAKAPELKETEIRSALDHHLRQHTPKGARTLMRHEMGVCNGARRIDLAVIGAAIDGYEIKSDDDTLVRLQPQADDYGRVFDHLTLVTTETHLSQATAKIPRWWGIILAHRNGQPQALEVLREPTQNVLTEPFATAQLLWRAEALEELRNRNQGRGLSKKPRHHIWAALAALLPMKELNPLVRHRLITRPEWQRAS